MGKFDILAQINKMTGPKAATTETKVEQTKPVDKAAPVKKTKAVEPAPVEKKVEPEHTTAVATVDNTLPAENIIAKYMIKKGHSTTFFLPEHVEKMKEYMGTSFRTIKRIKKCTQNDSPKDKAWLGEMVVMSDYEENTGSHPVGLANMPLYYLDKKNGAYKLGGDSATNTKTYGKTPKEWEEARARGLEVPLEPTVTFFFMDENKQLYEFTAYGRYDQNGMSALLTSGPGWIVLGTETKFNKKQNKNEVVATPIPCEALTEFTDEQLSEADEAVESKMEWRYKEGWITGKPEVVAPDDEELPA